MIRSGNNTGISRNSDCSASNIKHAARREAKIQENSRPLRGSHHNPDPNPKKTESTASDLEEGEIVERAQRLDIGHSNDETNQIGPAQLHKKHHLAYPFGDTRSRRPLQTVSPNKQEDASRKGHRYKTSAGLATISSRPHRSDRLHANAFTSDLGKSKWVSEQHIGDLY